MKYYEILYENEVKNKILDYEKLVDKYVSLLDCYFIEDLYVYHNKNYLKNVVLGFNYYHTLFIGQSNLPNDYILNCAEIWNEIITKENLTITDYLFIITFKVIKNVLMVPTKENLYLAKDLLINFYSIYDIYNIEYKKL